LRGGERALPRKVADFKLKKEAMSLRLAENKVRMLEVTIAGQWKRIRIRLRLKKQRLTDCDPVNA
jgi:hypothetical protein